ncbi:MAG: hypothetical protein AAF806_26915 [Bacteroidota bacterium]
MNEAIRQIYSTAMDLSDLARIKRHTLDEKVYLDYLKAAYELELYALAKMDRPSSDNERIWQASIIQSAGWLALKCGQTEQAIRLAENGLKIPTDGYILSKLAQLKSEAIRKLEETHLQEQNAYFSIYGLLSAVDVETHQINIKDQNNKKYVLFVKNAKTPEIARLFLGETVAVEASTNPEGEMIVETIRWAA